MAFGTQQTRIFGTCFLIVTTVALSLVAKTPAVPSQTQGAEESIAEAEKTSGSAYVALVNAERSGGDISRLAIKFNTALEKLAHAKILLRAGRVDSALVEAEDVRSSFVVLIQDADRLADVASRRTQHDRFSVYFMISIAVAATTGGFYVSLKLWRRFDLERTLKMEIVEKENHEG
jgi:glucose/arabinose dehydrogenase